MNAASAPSPRRRPRLASVFTIAVFLTVALTTLLQLALVDHFGIEFAGKDAGLRLQQLSWQMRDALDTAVSRAGADARLLADIPDIRQAKSPAEARAVLESLQRSVPDYAWIGIARLDGKVYAATAGLLENADVSSRPWFKAGLKGATASDYHPAVLLSGLLPQAPEPWRFIDVAVPVLDAAGQPQAVLGVHMSWGWARRQAQELLVPALKSYGAEIFVVRSDGLVILGPRGFEEKHLSALPSLQAARSGATGSLEETWPDGRRYLTGYTRTGDAKKPVSLQWSVLVRQPMDVAMAVPHALQRRILGLSAALATLLAMLAIILARYLTHPITLLNDVLEKRSRANVGRDALQPIPQIDSFREVQTLSSTMRDMIENEERHLRELQTFNEHLEATVAERTAELRLLAMRDTLTGLPNRRALMEALKVAMQRAERLRQSCAVLFMDLNGFKGINDTYGHEEGDELLRQFAARITASVRRTDTVARLAGDEFVVVLEMVADLDAVGAAIGKIRGNLDHPYALKTATVTVSASIGAALHQPGDPLNIDALLSKADVAMYAEKRGEAASV